MRRTAKFASAVGCAALATLLPRHDLRAGAPPGHYSIADDTVLDTQTGLLWQRVPDDADRDFTDARGMCAGLNLGGFSSGWRLPNVREALSLFDERASSAPMWDAVFSGPVGAEYWTSTALATETSAGWSYSGDPHWLIYFRDRSSTLRVRCVH